MAFLVAPLLLQPITLPFAPAVLDVTSKDNGGSRLTTINISHPAGMSAGNLMIAFLGGLESIDFRGLATPAGWTRIAYPATSTDDLIAVYYKIVEVADIAGSTTWTSVSSSGWYTGNIVCFVDGGVPTASATNYNATGSTTYTLASGSTVANYGDVIISFVTRSHAIAGIGVWNIAPTEEYKSVTNTNTVNTYIHIREYRKPATYPALTFTAAGYSSPSSGCTVVVPPRERVPSIIGSTLAPNAGARAASITITHPTVAVGQLLIAMLSHGEDVTFRGISTPAGWTRIAYNSVSPATGPCFAVYYKVAVLADVGGNTTFSTVSNTFWASGIMVAMQDAGIPTASTIDISDVGTSRTSHTGSTGTVTAGDTFLWFAGSDGNNAAMDVDNDEAWNTELTNAGAVSQNYVVELIGASGSVGPYTARKTNPSSDWASCFIYVPPNV